MRILLPLLLSLPLTAFAVERPVVQAKSEIGFTVTQMGVGVSGKFSRFIAKVDLDPAKPESSKAELEVDIASLSTGDADADSEALKKAWLDALGFPKATFKSSAVRALGGGRYEVKGQLSIKGKPREITVPFTLSDAADGTSTATGSFSLNRTDFGIGGGEWNEGDLVANAVPVRFRLTLAKPLGKP